MNIKLNIDNINMKDYKKICKMLKQQNQNSTITADLYSDELKEIILNFVKQKLDIYIKKLSFDIQVDIIDDDLNIDFILPEDDDLKEFEMFKKELKHIMV